MATETRSVTISGDMLTVEYQGSMWVSPCNGQQHATATEAMRCEVVSYLRSCGEQVEYDSPEVVELLATME